MGQSLELKLSLLTCLLLTGMYVVYDWLAEPSGGHPFGHALGIVGTLLMLFTEVAYSARKRIAWLKRAGPMRWWLATHIFGGIVGPFLVLTHSALKFQGLAGFALALTALVVASGFFGRYLYNAIPRTISGAEATLAELESEVKTLRTAVSELAARRSLAVQKLVEAESRRGDNLGSDWTTVLLRAVDDWRYRRALRRQVRGLEKAEKRKLGDVERLLAQQKRLERQMRTYDSARQLLGLWHLIHVPMGLALFGSVGIHIVATLYYGALPLP
jgi:hypothetical protein